MSWREKLGRCRVADGFDKKNNQGISPKVVKFLVLLCQLPVNVGLHLIKLQLDAESFAFFMLQSALRQTDT